MTLLSIGLVLAALLLLTVYVLSYLWIRELLGEAGDEAVPMARVVEDRKHRGYRTEPSWIRPLQAFVLATGLTGAFAAAVSFVAVAGVMLLV